MIAAAAIILSSLRARMSHKRREQQQQPRQISCGFRGSSSAIGENGRPSCLIELQDFDGIVAGSFDRFARLLQVLERQVEMID